MNDLNAAFAEAEVPAPKTREKTEFAPIPDGDYNFILKNYDVKTWDDGGTTITLQFYLPKLNRVVFDRYNASRMKYLKITFTKLGTLRSAGGQDDLEGSLQASVGVEGELALVTSSTNAKYQNVFVNSVVSRSTQSDDSVPF